MRRQLLHHILMELVFRTLDRAAQPVQPRPETLHLRPEQVGAVKMAVEHRDATGTDAVQLPGPQSAHRAQAAEPATKSPAPTEGRPAASNSRTRANTPAPSRGAAGRWLQGSPSPNPAGRPSIPAEVKEAARAHTLAAIETLARVMADESAPPSAQVMAATAMLDRGWGKPTVSIEAKIATVDMNKAHLEALNRLSRRKGL